MKSVLPDANKFKSDKRLKLALPHLLCILGLTLLILIFFSRLFLPRLSLFITPSFGRSELISGYYPLKYMISEYLANNRIPIWTNLIKQGFPITAEGLDSFLATSLIIYKFISFPLAINVNFIAIFLTTGVGTYLLAIELGLWPPLGLLAALIFTFSGFTIAQISQLSIIQTASLLPLELFLVEKLLKQKSLILLALLAIVISQQIFSGHQEITAYSIITIFLYIIVRKIVLSPKLKQFSYKNLGIDLWAFTLVILSSICLSAVQILPQIELFRQSARSQESNLPASFAYPLKDLLTFLNPFWFGSVKLGTYASQNQVWEIFWEDTGYVGLLPVICLILSLFMLKRRRTGILSEQVPGRLSFQRDVSKDSDKRLTWANSLWSGRLTFLILAVVSILLVLGVNSPLFFLFKFPPLSLFRVPSRFLMLTDLSLAMLCGFVCQTLLAKMTTRLAFGAAITLLIAAQTSNMFYYFFNYQPTGDATTWLAKPELIKAMNTTQERPRMFNIENSSGYNAIFQDGWTDTAKYLAFNEGLPYYSSVFYNIDSLNPSVTLGTERMKLQSDLMQLFQTVPGASDAKLASFSAQLLAGSNVRYLILPNTMHVTNLKLVRQSSQYALYENPLTLGRAYISHSIIPLRTNEDLLTILNSKTFKPGNVVFSENMLNLDQPNPKKCSDTVKWTGSSDFNVKLEAVSCGKGLLVLADTYYPGWQAYVDGKITQIYPVNINLRGILLTEGKHEVSFIYRPLSLILGAVISVIAYAIAVLILAFYCMGRKIPISIGERKRINHLFRRGFRRW